MDRNRVQWMEDYKAYEYLNEMKKEGKIRRFGFSFHDNAEALDAILSKYAFDFVQVQLNYLDWTLQNAKAKYELLTQRGIPVWVMEPLRGGKLSTLSDDMEKKFKVMRADESVSAWGFRFLQGLDNVTMVLSGMSSMDQMRDNVKTFSRHKPLDEAELELCFEAARKLYELVPCTACRYCCDGCPAGLDIPLLISLYNDTKVASSINHSMYYRAIDEDKRFDKCINCGQCAAVCPQGIDVPTILAEADAIYKAIPDWEELCRKREAAAEKK